MVIVWHTGEVTENQVLNHKFRVMKLRVVDEPKLTFEAGQFILMRMGRPEKVNDYSPCNVPEPGVIETLIDITPADFAPPAGVGSRYLRDLTVGDKVEFAGPAGDFVYREDGAEKLWFVATGSGLSSLWSILRDRLAKGEKRPMKLWWGMRYEKYIIWEEELNELKAKYPNFSFEYVLSQPENGWAGKKGHATEYVLEAAGKLNDEEKGKVSVYLCGNNEMITEVSTGLFMLGVPRERVYWEKYF